MDLTNFRNDAALLQDGEGFERGLFLDWIWLAPWLHTGTRAVCAARKNIPRLLSPIYTERLAGMISSNNIANEQPNDALQWLLNAHKKQKGTDITREGMTNEQLFPLYMPHRTQPQTSSTICPLILNISRISELRLSKFGLKMGDGRRNPLPS